MRAIRKMLLSTCAVGTVMHGRAARAQPDQPTTTSPSQTGTEPSSRTSATDADATTTHDGTWSDSRMRSRIGITAILGGGVTGFTDKAVRDTTSSIGGLWDLRVTIGSHVPLALEVGYVGSATSIDGLPLGQSATLIGTAVEGALRFNVLPHRRWNPYIFAGVGWQRYDVVETNVMLLTSGMNDKDNLLEFPLGAGVSYRHNGLVADVRGTFRVATDQNLVLTTPALSPTSDDFAPMHTWEASAAIGYEF
jgi:hypothetical protein